MHIGHDFVSLCSLNTLFEHTNYNTKTFQNRLNFFSIFSQKILIKVSRNSQKILTIFSTIKYQDIKQQIANMLFLESDKRLLYFHQLSLKFRLLVFDLCICILRWLHNFAAS